MKVIAKNRTSDTQQIHKIKESINVPPSCEVELDLSDIYESEKKRISKFFILTESTEVKKDDVTSSGSDESEQTTKKTTSKYAGRKSANSDVE